MDVVIVKRKKMMLSKMDAVWSRGGNKCADSFMASRFRGYVKSVTLG